MGNAKNIVDGLIRDAGAVPPVDTSKCETIGGMDPRSPEHRKLKPNGQQMDYVILSEDERKRGFVRPVRRTYVHKKCGVATTMGLALAETYARKPDFYGGTFCCGCGTHFTFGQPDGDFTWDDGSKVGE
jgi:hypothetical protein